MDYPMEQVVRLQREFALLYQRREITAIEVDSVLVQYDILAKLSDMNDWSLSLGSDANWIHASVVIGETKFHACLSYEDAGEIGLTLPVWI